ncbi:MAG: hypothetical protein ACRBBR_10555 [Cellvibrionaceae bacterium]
MLYLFVQTFFWILAAFILGLIVGWWLSGRCRCEQQEQQKIVQDDAPLTEVDTVDSVVNDAWKPQGFSSAPADLDDLKRIKGIGPVIEKTLNSLGIYTFKQISEFSEDNVKWVDDHIDFPGRINREQWVSQASQLATGGTTDFSARVDKGDVTY